MFCTLSRPHIQRTVTGHSCGKPSMKCKPHSATHAKYRSDTCKALMHAREFSLHPNSPFVELNLKHISLSLSYKMSEYSSAQEDSPDSDRQTNVDQDLRVVNEDHGHGSHSCSESVDVSDEELLDKEPSNVTLQEMKRIAFQKPAMSLTIVTEDADGNVTQVTQEFDDDKHVTLIIDNEGESDPAAQEKLDASTEKGDEDCMEEDLGQALKDTKVMTSLMKSRKGRTERSACRSAGMQRRHGIIVNSSDSEDDDFLTKMALMPIKSDDTPVLTVPIKLEGGCLTDVENIED